MAVVSSSLLPHPMPRARGRVGERILARELAEIPRWYSPYLHLAGTTGVALATLLVSALSLHRVRAIELLAIPATLLLSNAVEWRSHRGVLHRRVWPVRVLYDRHTPIHHNVYRYDSMAMRSTREFRLVLIPAAGVAAVIAISAPIAYAVARLLTYNCGWIALATSGVYVLTYELTHLAYHMPEDSWVGRLPLVGGLREHHRRHHHPALMQKWNFNVTVPLFDWIHGTRASDDTVERAVARSHLRETGDS
jgi:sterol desaturase/sphingolipid hydroxylase (fatty acid hydroxylase superfamily)